MGTPTDRLFNASQTDPGSWNGILMDSAWIQGSKRRRERGRGREGRHHERETVSRGEGRVWNVW
jgi:hypothetical protein